MEYIIASHKAVLREGWKPASTNIVSGRVILNENELHYQYPDHTLEEAAGIVDGQIVSRQTALDYLSGTKTFEQIKAEIS